MSRLVKAFAPIVLCLCGSTVHAGSTDSGPLAGANAANPYMAVGLLSLCFGCTQFTEGSFWSAATYAGAPHTATATGLMNTGGNAAGFLAPAVGMMVDQLGWLTTFASGSAFAVVGAVLWLFVRVQDDAQRPV